MNAPYPYPPHAHQAPQGPAPSAPGTAQYWTPSEIVGAGWNRMKAHLGLFIGVSLAFAFIALPLPYTPIVLTLTHAVEPNSVEFHGANLGQSLVFMVVCSYLLSGFLRVCITAAKGETPTFGMFFGGRGFLSVLAFQTLLTLPGIVGSVINVVGAATEIPALFFVSTAWNLLIIVPLVFVWLVWGQAPSLAVDKGMGIGEAMRTSANITRGQRANIFLASLLAGLVMMAGAMACGIGMIVTGPLFYVIMAVLYVRLTGQDPHGTAQGGMGNGYGGYATYPSHPGAPQGYGPPAGPPPPPGGYGSQY